MVIKSPRTSLPPVTVNIDDTPLTQVSSHKHIGLVFNDKLTWSDHTDLVVHRVPSKLGLLRRLQHSWPSLALRTIYLTCIRPSIEYGVVAWGGLSKGDSDRLENANGVPHTSSLACLAVQTPP